MTEPSPAIIVPTIEGLDVVAVVIVSRHPETREYTMVMRPVVGAGAPPGVIANALRMLATGIEADAVFRGESL